MRNKTYDLAFSSDTFAIYTRLLREVKMLANKNHYAKNVIHKYNTSLANEFRMNYDHS